MTHEEATNAIKRFLEQEPPLKPLHIVLDEPVQDPKELIPARIQRSCSHQSCRDHESTTWATPYQQSSPLYQQGLVVFQCQHCDTTKVEIWVLTLKHKTEKRSMARAMTNTGSRGPVQDYYIEFEFLKVGQWPPWAPNVSRRLEKNLGKNLDFFRRAVSCIKQSYGIGACAYMRRVIEEETDHILDLIERAAETEGDQETLANVADARKGKAASNRLQLAANKLPKSLCPNGVNPLGRLFGAFSEGVHELPEDQALKLAQELLETFVFLFENLRERIEQAEEFAKRIKAVGNPASTRNEG